MANRDRSIIANQSCLPCSSLPLPKQIPPPPGTPAIKTQARSVTILPNFVGLRFAIHNGKTYTEVTITEDMVGKKLGEFALYVFLELIHFLFQGERESL